VNVEHAGRGASRLRQLRLERGLKQAALAARVGVDHTTVSARERGRQTPASGSLAGLAAALGVLVEELGFPPDDATTHRDGDVDRQQFLTGLAAGAAGAAFGSAPGTGRHVGRAEVATFQHLLRNLYELDDHHGGDRQVYGLTVGMVQRLERVLEESSYAAGTRAALLAVLGGVTEHAGWLAYDAGRHADARRWWLEALHQAQLAGADEVTVVVMASMARQAVDLGRPREAVSLADAALERSGARATARLTSVLLARRALAHAHDGDRRGAEHAFGQAGELLGAGPEDDDPPWTGFWGTADLAWHEAQAARALGSCERAEECTRAALTAVDPVRYARSSTLYLAFLSTLLAQRGAFDEGIHAAADAVLAAAHLGSARVQRQIETGLRAVEARDQRAESQAFVRWASSRLRAA